MDGGRRLLRPLSIQPRDTRADAYDPRTRRRGRVSLAARIAARIGSPRPDTGALLAIGLMAGALFSGLSVNGGLEGFTSRYGAPRDLAARIAGFPLDVVTISGQKELTEAEILEHGQLSTRKSLLFLDAAALRDRLKEMPLVKEASVRKLYPNRVVIEVVERTPHALWQHDGEVSIIARDGTVIDSVRDDRFFDLPFVSGQGANLRIAEFVTILDAAGELRGKIRAGMRVADRRWTLKMTSGVEVMLPERNPVAALATLAQLEREARILNKDILSIDMRLPGRVTAQLSEEAYAARLEAKARKPNKAKGSET